MDVTSIIVWLPRFSGSYGTSDSCLAAHNLSDHRLRALIDRQEHPAEIFADEAQHHELSA